MKKSKILVPAIALLALGVAGSTVGTVAWFAAAGTPISAGSVQTGTATATTTADTLGSFTISVKTVTFDNPAIALTNEAGETYVWNGTGNIKVSDQTNKTSPVDLVFTVTYVKGDSEGNPSDAEIASLWTSSIASYNVSINIKDLSHTLTPTSPATKCLDEGGLKFGKTSGDAVAAAASADLNGVSIEMPSALTFTSGSADTTSFNDVFHVGIVGVPNKYQYATDAYQLQVSPVVAAKVA